jgi:hypothetical protein
VPPQGLIPNRKRKPTPSIASTSSATQGQPPKKKPLWQLIFEKLDTPDWAYLEPNQAVIDQNRDDMSSHRAKELLPITKKEVANLILSSDFKYCDPTNESQTRYWQRNIDDLGHMYFVVDQKEIVFADPFGNTLWGKKDNEKIRQIVVDVLKRPEVTKYGKPADLPYITESLNVWINGVINVKPYSMPEDEQIRIENFHPATSVERREKVQRIHQELQNLMFGAWDKVMPKRTPLDHNVSPYLRQRRANLISLKGSLTSDRSPEEAYRILLNDPYYTAIENVELRPDIEVPDLIQIGRGFDWKMTKEELHAKRREAAALKPCVYPLCPAPYDHEFGTCPALVEICKSCDRRGHSAVAHEEEYADLVTLEAMYLVFSPCHFKAGNIWALNNRASRADWKISLHHRNYLTFPKNIQTGLSIPNYAVKDTWLAEAVQVNKTAAKVVADTAEIIQEKTAERPTLVALRLRDKEEKAATIKEKLAVLEKVRKDKANAAARLATPKPTFTRKPVTAPTSTITKPVEPMETEGEPTTESIAAGFTLAEIQAVFIAAYTREHGVPPLPFLPTPAAAVPVAPHPDLVGLGAIGITADPNYEAPATNAGSNVDPTQVLKPVLDIEAEPVGSVRNLFNGVLNKEKDDVMESIDEVLADHDELDYEAEENPNAGYV